MQSHVRAPQDKPALLFVLHGREGEAVSGTYSVEHITYHSPETGYAVVRLAPADSEGGLGIIAVGQFGDVRTGECYRIEGTWRQDPKYGMQVKVSSSVREAPRSLEAIARYLSGASIKGLGPHYASSLVAYFGAGTFQELQSGGEHLQQVPGIGPVRAQTIRESWSEHQGIHDLMVNLQGVAGLTPSQAQRIYRQLGHRAWDILARDPYILAEQVRGFGFKTCDRIAKSLGMAHDAPERIQAGVLHLLKQALGEGHLWSERDALATQAAELLGVDPPAVSPQIETLLSEGRATRQPVRGAPLGDARLSDRDGVEPPQDVIYLPDVLRTEERIAQQLATLVRLPAISRLRRSLASARSLVRRHAEHELTQEQQSAIESLLTGSRIVILTGGPGTGKTTTVRSLIACLEEIGVDYALCATTGRASKQLAASTERSAATVHRHLRIGGGQGSDEPVRESVLVIDEASMIDIWLMDQILSRLGPDTHLVLIGDVDQLPPVGPGLVLSDLIDAEERGAVAGIHVTRLKTIFRQIAGNESLIVTNCHRVRAGERPVRQFSEDSDYYEMFRETPEQALELAVSLAAGRLPRYLGVPPSEVQVLAPMHGGVAGIRSLNLSLQEALNPATPAKEELASPEAAQRPARGQTLRVGDKVRQTRNNYQKQVFNGDLGTITHIDSLARSLSVNFDGHGVTYTFDELDEIVHSWAMTVHAAQGSQWPAVVVVMLTNHYIMLERNILYTALSRAQRMAVLITQDQAVRIAVSQNRAARRRTLLAARLLRLTAA